MKHSDYIEKARLLDIDDIAWLLKDLDQAKREIKQIQHDALADNKQLQAQIEKQRKEIKALRYRKS